MAAPRQVVPHSFAHYDQYSRDARGRRATAEAFSPAARRALPGQLHRHFDDTPPSDAFTALVRGRHTFICPRLDSMLIGEALAYGARLLEMDVSSAITIVVPRWTERWWWAKMLLTGPYNIIATFPPRADVYRHFANWAPAPVNFPIVIARLEAPATVGLLQHL